MHKGFTIVECVLAGAFMSLVALALLEGIGVSTRVARENAQYLAADGVVWDAIWKKFNEDYENMKSQKETLTEEAAPSLYYPDSAPELTVSVWTVTEYPIVLDDEDLSPKYLKCIKAELEWGPANNRQTHSGWTYRSDMQRVSW